MPGSLDEIEDMWEMVKNILSTVPEVIVANHCGIKVFGISVITDLGVEGKIVEVTHEEVQKAADAAQPKMTTIMRELINRA